jgi:hypothetical protein
MNIAQHQLKLVEDEISKLEPVVKAKVWGLANQLHDLLNANPEHANLAIALVGAQKAAE